VRVQGGGEEENLLNHKKSRKYLDKITLRVLHRRVREVRGGNTGRPENVREKLSAISVGAAVQSNKEFLSRGLLKYFLRQPEVRPSYTH